MSNTENQNEFDFIKEEILEKKRNHRKELIYTVVKTALCAVIFAMVSAFVFAIIEPKLSELYGNAIEEEKETINLVTNVPNSSNLEDDIVDTSSADGIQGLPQNAEGIEGELDQFLEPDAVVVEKSIEASIEDYVSMRAQLKKLAMQTNKSMVTVSCTKVGSDWFQNPKIQNVTTTGIVFGNNGVELTILVSYDRIEGASKITVCFSEDCIAEATLLDYEEDINLAVITVKLQDINNHVLESMEVAKFGESYTMTVGSPIIAVGSPNGYPNSMEDGIITSKGSYYYITDNRIDLFNTDTSNNENGDGVIINLKGEIIGIITRTLKEGKNENLTTVMGISRLIPIIERMANNKPRMYFGIRAEDMTETALKQNGLNVSGGIYINEVLQKSPAFHAGLKGGDIIISINDILVKSTSAFYHKISEFNSGDEIEVKYIRTSQATKDIRKVKVTLEDKKNTD